jgi:asparagine synthase (glutamine-hydrolysing)
MGAIGAVLARNGPADPDVAARMVAVVPHRGTVHAVVTLGASVLCAVAYPDRRDAVLASDAGLAGAFVGALDNREELTAWLAEREVVLSSVEPAAIMLAMFRLLGEETPNRLRGTFAGIVTDGARLWAFRDHLGFCPLFYRDAPAGFYAATEAKQVVAGAAIPAEPDPDVVERIFYGRYDDDTPAALKGVRRLQKSSVIAVTRERASVRRYWHPEGLLETARLAAREVDEGFHTLMAQAVRRMLTRETAVSLSGGIDSSAVAAYAASAALAAGYPLAAISAVYPSAPSVDERPYTEAVAAYLQMALRTYEPAARPTDRLREWMRLCDGPVPTISLPEIDENYSLAGRLGYRTVLTGELGEFVYDMRRHLVSHLLWHARAGALRAHARAEHARGASWPTIGRRILSASMPRTLTAWYLRWRQPGGGRRIPEWLDTRTANEVPYFVDLELPPGQRWIQQQLLAFVGPGITLEADEVCAAARGVHVRRPLADVDLWEFFLSLPAEMKFPDSHPKTLVRRMLRGRVPDSILDRSDKTTFNEAVLSKIDYDALRRWLTDPPRRIRGVNYEILASRLARRDFGIVDFIWAKDLAAAHAFLSLW